MRMQIIQPVTIRIFCMNCG